MSNTAVSPALSRARVTDDAVKDYLQTSGLIPLLTAEEETELARRIEVGVFAQEKLDSGDIPAELAAELRTLVREGEAANRRFVRSNLRLVVNIAKRYLRHNVPFMDLIQEGNIGLDRAVKKFDYRQGYKFSTYATWWIRQSISRGIADSARLIRVPVHTGERISILRKAVREF
jgi:RNA polymerase primary sigma factor